MRGKNRWGLLRRRKGAHFKCDVVVSDADFQLLFADDVFLWPVRVVFPLNDSDREKVSRFRSGEGR